MKWHFPVFLKRESKNETKDINKMKMGIWVYIDGGGKNVCIFDQAYVGIINNKFVMVFLPFYISSCSTSFLYSTTSN